MFTQYTCRHKYSYNKEKRHVNERDGWLLRIPVSDMHQSISQITLWWCKYQLICILRSYPPYNTIILTVASRIYRLITYFMIDLFIFYDVLITLVYIFYRIFLSLYYFNMTIFWLKIYHKIFKKSSHFYDQCIIAMW